MKVTIPSAWAVNLRDLLSINQRDIIDKRRQLWWVYWSNYSIEIYHNTINTLVIDTIETASLTESRVIKQDQWFSLVTRNLVNISLLADVDTDVIITIV